MDIQKKMQLKQLALDIRNLVEESFNLEVQIDQLKLKIEFLEQDNAKLRKELKVGTDNG